MTSGHCNPTNVRYQLYILFHLIKDIKTIVLHFVMIFSMWPSGKWKHAGVSNIKGAFPASLTKLNLMWLCDSIYYILPPIPPSWEITDKLRLGCVLGHHADYKEVLQKKTEMNWIQTLAKYLNKDVILAFFCYHCFLQSSSIIRLPSLYRRGNPIIFLC